MKVTYGHSKDNRPDFKQILICMGVTPQRIPVFAKDEDGALSDKKYGTAASSMSFTWKIPERIEALSAVFVMAWLFYDLLEYRVRQQMAQ